jgi:hypothetical protein
MDGYNEIREAMKTDPPSLSAFQITPILYNLLFYLSDEDMAIRAQTSSTFSFVLKVIAEYSQRDIQFYPKALLTQLIIPGLKRKLTGKDNRGRIEAIGLFGQIASSFPTLYPDLNALISSEYPLSLMKLWTV